MNGEVGHFVAAITKVKLFDAGPVYAAVHRVLKVHRRIHGADRGLAAQLGKELDHAEDKI